MTAITAPIELFLPTLQKYREVTLLDANDSFTHNLVQAFLKLGAPVRVFRLDTLTLKQIAENLGHYLVLSPGPGVPDDAGCMKAAIQYFKGKIPILGVCLGMQAINEVFGGKTVRADYPVHGKISRIMHNDTGIFTDVKTPTTVARYHSLKIANVSAEFEIQSVYKGVIMAIKHKELLISGVQFHPESFLSEDGLKMLENFLLEE